MREKARRRKKKEREIEKETETVTEIETRVHTKAALCYHKINFNKHIISLQEWNLKKIKN